MSAESATSPGGEVGEVASALLARRLVVALAGSGVRQVVYCPGSRDAPLGYALHSAEQAGLVRVHVRLDERAAAFMALGIAKATAVSGQPTPVVVVATSGTAVANLHPALCEADSAGLPVIACTADRPHEMWGTGANQTTRQLGLFGPIMRRVEDVPADFPPDERLDGLVSRAVRAGTGELGSDPGPVQINVCFREPLAPRLPWRPDGGGPRLPWRPDGGGPQQAWPTGTPHIPASAGAHRIEMPAQIEMPPRTVVVAGDAAGPLAQQVALDGGWPLLAEPSSGARFGPNALTDYQRCVRGPLSEELEGVLVYGHPTLSRPVSALLADRGPRIVAVVDRARWTDVSGLAQVFRGPLVVSGAAPSGWLDAWQSESRPDRYREPSLKEAACASIWTAHCAQDAPSLVIGASEPIRAFDRWAVPGRDAPMVIANRGLAGIDGTVATATGVWAGLGRPVRVVIGDLTAIHDAMGMLRGEAELEPDVQVVVLADGGGAIFAGLEHAGAEPELFRRFFRTPQLFDLAGLARSIGADYRRVVVGEELEAALREPIHGRSYLEVPLTPRG
ncbi:2-succinyl-5-enolpyruvyl-6-hydroxy-3-cyclohexene-1-carboxylate synthase [Propionibacterium cyclohexanicum]|uniref:2-succinyl-5-enolpyruvyl-6-hydroxy-3-cyclohexene-1-carboxylate synthase n=1 Tax=Propionibacterium cyclohexanicum TaxID=64702 RepID=A0A1H9QDG2_9ACTN|nr:2-succinyl-5-enolpyruvyl-6-hydroxy-3-cyclohexene-1-carboxylic-acid synthase [Propionibacterium cyclohexanicum]SER58477.1 2-succinyl-5-enolpyruvyl-6-hydroxy-3-cyclohexene-1-carboxylate synthase [Propionibacterium cyclohexanicum]